MLGRKFQYENSELSRYMRQNQASTVHICGSGRRNKADADRRRGRGSTYAGEGSTDSVALDVRRGAVTGVAVPNIMRVAFIMAWIAVVASPVSMGRKGALLSIGRGVDLGWY